MRWPLNGDEKSAFYLILVISTILLFAAWSERREHTVRSTPTPTTVEEQLHLVFQHLRIASDALRVGAKQQSAADIETYRRALLTSKDTVSLLLLSLPAARQEAAEDSDVCVLTGE